MKGSHVSGFGKNFSVAGKVERFNVYYIPGFTKLGKFKTPRVTIYWYNWIKFCEE